MALSPNRCEKRDPVQIPVHLFTQDREIAAFTDNVSSGGLSFRSEVALEKHSPIQLKVGFGDINYQWLALTGEVVYCNQDSKIPLNHYLIGIKLSNASKIEKEVISTIIQKYAKDIYQIERALVQVHIFSKSIPENSSQKKIPHVEKRSYPRVLCQLNLTNSNNALIATIENISFEGCYFRSDRELKEGEDLFMEFLLPNFSHHIRASTKIIHAASKKGGQNEWYGYGARFQKLSLRDKSLLKNFILSRVSTLTLREAQRQYNESAGKVVSITAPSKIEKLIQELKKEAIPLSMIMESSNASVKGMVAAIDGQLMRINLEASPSVFQDSHPVVISFSYHFDTYSFETVCVKTGSSTLEVRMPQVIIHSDKRSLFRQQPGNSVYASVQLQNSDGALETFVCLVADQSPFGLSFITAQDCYNRFQPGRKIERLELLGGGQRLAKEHAVIMHVSPNSSNDHLINVGIEFDIPRADYQFQDENFSRYQNTLEGEKIAARRSSDNSVKVARYFNHAGEEIVGIINSTARGNEKLFAPVVVIPPAYGRRKESTSALAITLIENFRKQGKDLGVIRFDYTRAIGESFNDVGEPKDGREYLNIKYSQYVEDIKATIRYAKDNPLVCATDIILVSFSFNGPMARRVIVEDTDKNIGLWIAPVGTPDSQELIKNSGGGIDYLGNFRNGIKSGIVNFLGSLLNMDQYCEDAIEHQLAFIENARREMSAINIPVIWIYGKHDAWINPRKIKDIMSVQAPGSRKIIQIPTGHMLTSSGDALNTFKVITECVWEYLYDEKITAANPDREALLKANKLEWERTAKTLFKNKQEYWKKYLLGETAADLGFDIIMNAFEYHQLLDDQINLLQLPEGGIIADMGTGTGNVIEAYLKQSDGIYTETAQRPKIIAVDLVYDVLKKSRDKNQALMQELKLDSSRITYITSDLEIGRLTPFQQLIDCQSADSVDVILTKIDGVNSSTRDAIVKNMDPTLLSILKGESLPEQHADFLKEKFKKKEIDIIEDIHHITGGIKNKEFQALNLNCLGSYRSLLSISLPFKTHSLDAIISSLVLSYILNPQELLSEFKRCLKPGGKLIISSMLPDTDISKVYTGMIEKIEKAELLDANQKEEMLKSARNFASSAALLIRLEEEGRFKFFSPEELVELFSHAGFAKIQSVLSFGNPPQAIIVSAENP